MIVSIFGQLVGTILLAVAVFGNRGARWWIVTRLAVALWGLGSLAVIVQVYAVHAPPTFVTTVTWVGGVTVFLTIINWAVANRAQPETSHLFPAIVGPYLSQRRRPQDILSASEDRVEHRAGELARIGVLTARVKRRDQRDAARAFGCG